MDPQDVYHIESHSIIYIRTYPYKQTRKPSIYSYAEVNDNGQTTETILGINKTKAEY